MEIDPNRVYIYRVEIDRAEAPFGAYRDLAHAALSRLEIPLPAAGSVLLKPNITLLHLPESRITTHPGFVAGLLDALIEKGVASERLVVAEGQAGERPDRGWTWEKTGYHRMLAERGVRLAAMDGAEHREVEVPEGVVYERLPMFREVTDCGFFLNVPVAKCHNLCCTTLNIKNLMGTLARPVRHLCGIQEVDKPFEDGYHRLTRNNGLSLHEERFCHKLCDLLVAHRSLKVPRLCVIDGLIGRDGTAFNEGENHPLGWALIGQNEVHVDAVGTYLMGLDPTATPYLRMACERGLGTNRIEEVEVVDLLSGEALTGVGLEVHRSKRVLMPVARCKDGYYDRFRADGSVVPWRIDDVNRRREEDGLEPIPVT